MAFGSAEMVQITQMHLFLSAEGPQVFLDFPQTCAEDSCSSCCEGSSNFGRCCLALCLPLQLVAIPELWILQWKIQIPEQVFHLWGKPHRGNKDNYYDMEYVEELARNKLVESCINLSVVNSTSNFLLSCMRVMLIHCRVSERKQNKQALSQHTSCLITELVGPTPFLLYLILPGKLSCLCKESLLCTSLKCEVKIA